MRLSVLVPRFNLAPRGSSHTSTLSFVKSVQWCVSSFSGKIKWLVKNPRASRGSLDGVMLLTWDAPLRRSMVDCLFVFEKATQEGLETQFYIINQFLPSFTRFFKKSNIYLYESLNSYIYIHRKIDSVPITVSTLMNKNKNRIWMIRGAFSSHNCFYTDE